MEIFRAFVYYSYKHGVYRADCGLFDKPSYGRKKREAVYNLTMKIRRKVDEAIKGGPVIAHFRSNPFCVGMELVLSGRIEPIREFDFKDSLGRGHRIHVYDLAERGIEE